MRIITIAALASLTTGCLPETEQQMIVVDGEGVVMAPPDTFNILAEIHTNAADQSEVLKLISQSIDKIGSGLPALEGLDTVEIKTATVSIKPIREMQCVKEADYSSRDTCPITGHAGSVTMLVSGTPAAIAGNALSYLSELGAAEVELREYSLSDLEEQKSAATLAALAAARAKATKLAEGMGASLGKPLRIQYGAGVRDNFNSELDDGVYTLASGPANGASDKFAPAVELSITPQPIEIREEVTAAFALNSSKP